MEYDEERELTGYVWEYFSHLLTPWERQVGIAIMWRQKAASHPPDVGHQLAIKWGHADDAEVNAALADGYEAFRRRVCARALAEAGGPLPVNRCPQCNRVVRTPQARQCFWCGCDWHGPESQPT
jgi:hypothetical protein